MKDDCYQEYESDLKTLYMQTQTLLWRNLNIFVRKKKILAFMLLTPIMICVMLGYSSLIVDRLKNDGYGDQPVEEVGRMARCTPNGREGCTTVGYSIIGDEASDKAGKYSMIHDLMKVKAPN